MNSNFYRRWVFFSTWLAVALMATGCGAKQYPVHGKVTVEGQPVTQGFVIFAPDKDNPHRMLGRGKIEPSGEYTMTYNDGSGVPAGWYKVMLEIEVPKAKPGQKAPPLPVDQKYLETSTSPLSVQVPEGPFDLALTKPK